MSAKVPLLLRHPCSVANMIGLPIYLVLVVMVAPPPVPQGEDPGPADGLLFAFFALPIWVVFVLVNLVWLVVILATIRRRGWSLLGIWALFFLAWIGVTFLGRAISDALFSFNNVGHLGVYG